MKFGMIVVGLGMLLVTGCDEQSSDEPTAVGSDTPQEGPATDTLVPPARYFPVKNAHLVFESEGYITGTHEIWWEDYGRLLYSRRSERQFIECRIFRDSILTMWDESEHTDSTLYMRYATNPADLLNMTAMTGLFGGRDSSQMIANGYGVVGADTLLGLNCQIWSPVDSAIKEKLEGPVETWLSEIGVEVKTQNYGSMTFGVTRTLKMIDTTGVTVPADSLVAPEGWGITYRGPLLLEHPEAQADSTASI